MTTDESEPITGPLLTATVFVAVAVLGAALFVSQSLDRTAQALRQFVLTVEDGSGGQGRPYPAPQGRLDPELRYPVRTEGAPMRGGAQAAVTIVEWSDFQCTFCQRVNPTLRRIEARYGEKVALVFKHLPLPMHPGAPAAHAAAEAAHRQGRFWGMHDKIFANPRDTDSATLARYAAELGLDLERFLRDIGSQGVRGRIRSDAEEARELGVSGTPSFFVNGRFLSGAQPYESFERVIDGELADPG